MGRSSPRLGSEEQANDCQRVVGRLVAEEICSPDGLTFLKTCYRFVALDWQHVSRNETPDAGFESTLRDYLIGRLPSWTVSLPREMGLGLGLATASGILHEVDVVASHDSVTGIIELKQRQDDAVNKNDVIVFFAKLLDYMSANPALLLQELIPVFITSLSFEAHAIRACLGLGIHPIAPGLRPYPLLEENERLMAREIQNGLGLNDDVKDGYLRFATRVAALGRELDGTWVGDRFVHVSESQIGVISARPPDPDAANEITELNGDCTTLLHRFKMAKVALG